MCVFFHGDDTAVSNNGIVGIGGIFIIGERVKRVRHSLS